jgi:cobalt-zinc-cadmium efflux system outer membrane protein
MPILPRSVLAGQPLIFIHARGGVPLRAEIVLRRLLLLSGLILPLGGCAWAVRERTDRTVSSLAAHPFDLAPEAATPPAENTTSASRPGERTAPGPRETGRVLLASASSRPPQPEEAARAQANAAMGPQRVTPARALPLKDNQVLAAAWTQTVPGGSGALRRMLDLEISPRLPGSEAPRIVLPADPLAREREIESLFTELPLLPVEPKPLPGLGGKPYTLADLQRLAAANSPTLRQAASDVQAAQGLLVQAKTYPNPVTGYIQDTSATNNTGGIQAGFVDQPIITGGKMKLGVGAAQKNVDNSILALKRARMDLATAVRNAYFTLLVDLETLAVTRALAQFSDDIYRLQVGLLKSTQFAPYEPTALRAQTYLNRLAYKQAIASYLYDWKALVATLGLPQLPLSEVAGQVDRFIPYYDYDDVRAYVLKNHTDMLTAHNGVRIAQYNLKLAQVTGVFPNLDVYMALEKDFMNPPHGTYQALALGLPLPFWNQNKGNIIAAQAALIRASKESHRVEVTLTNNLALAYEGYRNNLYAMEYYRRNVLPNLVRYYRGIHARRQIDPTSAFGDLVFAQQNLATNVQAYLGILQSLWTSVVGVADFLQTDDLYQLGKRHDLPQLPDFQLLRLSPPAHSDATLAASAAGGEGVGVSSARAPGADPLPSAPAGEESTGPAGGETGVRLTRSGAGGSAPETRDP